MLGLKISVVKVRFSLKRGSLIRGFHNIQFTKIFTGPLKMYVKLRFSLKRGSLKRGSTVHYFLTQVTMV